MRKIRFGKYLTQTHEFIRSNVINTICTKKIQKIVIKAETEIMFWSVQPDMSSTIFQRLSVLSLKKCIRLRLQID